MVLAVRDAPRVIGHEQQRMADGADHIVGELCGWVRRRAESRWVIWMVGGVSDTAYIEKIKKRQPDISFMEAGISSY